MGLVLGLALPPQPLDSFICFSVCLFVLSPQANRRAEAGGELLGQGLPWGMGAGGKAI